MRTAWGKSHHDLVVPYSRRPCTLSLANEFPAQQQNSTACPGTAKRWSNAQIKALKKVKEGLMQAQQSETAQAILQKDTNSIGYYRIIPKEQLPKSLQKMNFQTLHTKENANSFLNIFKKQKLGHCQRKARQKLRDKGHIMLLEEIYDKFNDPFGGYPEQINKETAPLPAVVGQLDQWEKEASKKKFSLARRQSMLGVRTSGVRNSGIGAISEERKPNHQKKQLFPKKFKIGSDYRAEVEKSLAAMSSREGTNSLTNRGTLIENNSKLLKKELDQMKDMIKKQIEEKIRKLSDSRKQHHRLYSERLRLQLEGTQLDEQAVKDEETVLHTLGYSCDSFNSIKIKELIEQKKSETEKNELKIVRIKKNIEFLEDQVAKNEEELRNIMAAEKAYYQASLRYGVDCRDSGLVWAIAKLKPAEISDTDFPEYIDKKSRIYLMTKAENDEMLAELLEKKRKFVHELGKENQSKDLKRSDIRSSIVAEERGETDCIKENSGKLEDVQEIPKNQMRPAKKISVLGEQLEQNKNIFKISHNRLGPCFGSDVRGMSGRQIYHTTSSRIKQIDFGQLKKQKAEKKDQILEYQVILRRIEELHIEIESQDLQHQNYLLSHHKDSKETFFMQAAACFGGKRAYSLTIKHFSWKHTL